MRYLMALCFCSTLAGCGDGSKVEVRPAKVEARVDSSRSGRDLAAGLKKMADDEEALEKDRPAIVRKAVDAMRKAAAENFGTAESQKAKITADESGLRDFGERNWEVTGRYEGPDQDGKNFGASWTARIFLLGGLQCESIKLGERQYP